MAIRWFDGFNDWNKQQLLQRLNTDGDGNLTLDGNPIGASGSGILTFNTLSDLQIAYPNGLSVPVWITSDNSWYYWNGATVVTDTTPPNITISPIGGTFKSSQTVTLTSNETATIYYTLDGSTPTTSSSVYSTPLTISSTTTVKYFGKDTSGNSSVVQSASFTIDTVAPNNVTNLTIGTVTTTNIPLTWILSSSSDVANYEVAYSSNGGTNYTVASSSINSSSTSYTISGLSSSTNYSVRVVAIDQVGNRSTGVTKTAITATPSDTTPPNDVTNLATSNVTSTSLTLSWTASTSTDIASYDVYNGPTLLGNTTNSTYNVSSLSASTQYTFKVVAKDTSGNNSIGVTTTITSAPADTTPPTVTISPAAGTYASTQSVTLSANETANIYYTLDGSTPTTSSSVYSSPISVATTTTIKYFAKDTAGNSSVIQSAPYTINITHSYAFDDTFSSGTIDTTNLATSVGGTTTLNVVNGMLQLREGSNASADAGIFYLTRNYTCGTDTITYRFKFRANTINGGSLKLMAISTGSTITVNSNSIINPNIRLQLFMEKLSTDSSISFHVTGYNGTISTSPTVQPLVEGEIYQVELVCTPTGVTINLYDSTGTQVATTGQLSMSTAGLTTGTSYVVWSGEPFTNYYSGMSVDYLEVQVV